MDYGFNKNSQLFEWHWNQKGTAADFGINNHTSVGATEQLLGEAAKIYRNVGRVLVIAGAVVDVWSIVVSSQPLRRSVGASGAYLGTAVAPGVGTAVGGFLGCTAGSFIGYLTAERTSGHLFDWTQGALFTKINGEFPPPVPAGEFRGGGGRSGGGGASGY